METLLAIVDAVVLLFVIATVIRVTLTGSGSRLLTIFVALSVAFFACVSYVATIKFVESIGTIWQALFLVALAALGAGLLRVLLAAALPATPRTIVRS